MERIVARARGMMLGLAIGDALGAPTEFLDLEQIRKRFGPAGIRDFVHGKGMFTDDTQLSMSVARALAAAGGGGLEELMREVSREFVEWLHSPDNFRAPGISTKQACWRLDRGVPWRESGVPGSKGCGSVMRTAPVGFYFRADPARLREAAHAIGIATHPNPTADAACLGAAYATALALEDAPLGEWPGRIREFTRGISADWDAALARVEEAVRPAGDDEAAALAAGEHRGWTADEVLAVALVCVLRHPEDFRACVLLAANNSGDSDSIGCVAGALQGARLGIGAIPRAWIEGIERRDDLIALADLLAASAP